MSRQIKKIISTLLIVSMMIGSTLPNFALDNLNKEEGGNGSNIVSTENLEQKDSNSDADDTFAATLSDTSDEEDEENGTVPSSEDEVEDDEASPSDARDENYESKDSESEDEENDESDENNISSPSETVDDNSMNTEEKEENDISSLSDIADSKNSDDINDDKATQSDIIDDYIISIDINTATVSVVASISDAELFGNTATKSDIATESELSDIHFYNGFIPEDFIVPLPARDDEELFGATSLPSSYDSRTKTNPANTAMSIIPPIRDQGSNGTCWAFATMGLVETSMRRKGLVDNEDDANLSELALSYFAYNLDNVTAPGSANLDTPGLEGHDYVKIVNDTASEDFASIGGNVSGGANLLSAYVGAVAENVNSTLDYSNISTAKTTELNGKYAFNSNSIKVSDVVYLNKNDVEGVKQAIMDYGAVAITFFGDGSAKNATYFDTVIGTEHYYYPNGDSETNQLRSANHAIIVVGWDDDIPSSYFKNTSTSYPGQATNDGGWLCKNSWGTEADGYIFANSGYFWMSYDEPSISTNMYAIDVIDKSTYKYNYHYDTTSMTAYSEGLVKTYDAAFANIFKVSDDEDQTLDAVSVGLYNTNTTFDIRIYTKDTAMSNPSDGTLKTSKLDIERTYAGIYTIELDDKVDLPKGTYYSIVLIMKGADVVPDQDGYFILTDYTASMTGYDEDLNTFNIYYMNAAELGQSMKSIIYNNNYYSWIDINEKSLQDVSGENYGKSLRIKGLTNPKYNVAPPAEGYYVLPKDWFDSTVTGISADVVENIKILKYNEATPSGATSWDLPTSSHGLLGYTKGNDIYIYAPADAPIKLPEDSSYMFSGQLTAGTPVSSLDPPVTGTNFIALKSISGLEKIDTSNATSMKGMFYATRALKTFNLSNFNTASVSDMSYMFSGSLNGVDTLDLSSFNTSKVTDFSMMFYSAGVKKINVTSFDTSAATDMSFMFCDFTESNLEEIDLSGFNTSNVVNMMHMISAPKVSTISVSSFDTSKVTDFEGMFWSMKELTSLDVSNFNTSEALSLRFMFWGCEKLTTLNLAGFNTTKVTNIENMFEECKALNTLTLSNFNTNNVTKMKEMFKNCTALEKIYVADTFVVNNTAETSDMFSGCTSINGGSGTTYSSSNVDGTYARIDQGTSRPGYFREAGVTRYTIKYNLGGGVGHATTPSNTTKKHGENITLNTPTNIETGWSFDGWFKESSLANAYTGTGDLTDVDGSTVNVYARWKVKITYNANDHGTNPSAVDVILNQNTTLPSIANVEGWTFDTTNSWYKESSNTNRVGKAGDSYKATAPTTLFAKWNENEYTITYKNADETIVTNWNSGYTAPSKRKYTVATTLPTGANISKTGYTFGGWYTNKDFTGTAVTTIPANTAANKTYYLKWNPITYTIKYNIGTAKATTPSDLTKTYGSNATLAVPATNEAGWTFVNWYKEAGLTNVYDGSSDLSSTANANVTIYAKWKVRVAYNVNGHGTVSPTYVDVVQGSTTTLPTLTNVTGYTFDTTNSWYKESSNTNLIGAAGSSYTATKPITLYAKWNENSYTITYKNADETTVTDWNSGYTAPTSRNYTAATTLPTAANLSKTGYTFGGWYDNKNFTGTAVTSIAANTAANKTYYIKWNENEYNIYYKHADGSDMTSWKSGFTAPTTRKYTEAATLPTSDNIDRSGYVFKGWYEAADFSGSVVTSITANTASDKTYYAKWNEIYTVSFDMTSYIGTLPTADQFTINVVAPTSQSIENGNTATRPTNNPTAEGVEFLGWFSDAACTTAFDFATAITANTVVYAKWRTATTITFIFETERGTAPINQYVVENNKVVEPNEIIVDGWTFKYWYENDENTAFDFTQTIPSTSASPRTLKAKWEANIYNIKYNIGTADASAPSNIRKTYNENVTLSTPSNVAAGWIFDGWYKETSYTNAYDGTTDLATASNATVNIYAKWKIEVSYDANGHGTVPASVIVDQNNNITLPTLADVEGFTFDKNNSWYKEAKLTTFIGKAGATYKVTEPLTLYAKWNEVKKEESNNNSNSGNYRPSNGGGSRGGSSGGTAGSATNQQQVGMQDNQSLAQALSNGNVILQSFSSVNANMLTVLVAQSSWSYDAIMNKWSLVRVTANGTTVGVANTFCQLSRAIEVIEDGVSKQVEVNDTYYFDEKGQMVTGWMQSADGKWYYFEDAKTTDEGKLTLGWKQLGGFWYYFNANGTMMTNGVTPDGYTIDANGQYVANGTPQVETNSNSQNGILGIIIP